jgi:hypothetical protein
VDAEEPCVVIVSTTELAPVSTIIGTVRPSTVART